MFRKFLSVSSVSNNYFFEGNNYNITELEIKPWRSMERNDDEHCWTPETNEENRKMMGGKPDHKLMKWSRRFIKKERGTQSNITNFNILIFSCEI